MFVRSARRHLDGKLFEWTLNLGAIWLSLAVLVWPQTVRVGAFKHLTDFCSETTLLLYSLIVGVVGSVALLTNGTSLVVGPIVRAVCAVARAALWGEVLYALWLLGVSQGVPSLGLGFWVLFTTSELYVASRAMTEAAVAARSIHDNKADL
jgi:hypothetical protein